MPQSPTNSSLIETSAIMPNISSSSPTRSFITNKPDNDFSNTANVTSFISISTIIIASRTLSSSGSYSHTPNPTSASYSSTQLPSSTHDSPFSHSNTEAQSTQIPTMSISQTTTSITSSYVTASKTAYSNYKIRINLTGPREIITPNANLFSQGEKHIDGFLINWRGVLINLNLLYIIF
ncbi:659_t:CDS:1 [Ambispora gerdemannii]|uniref:659_t:CDS:1 n=1 Tax=Ambispora gerdemannii TaxID=144530 RepID=A0A9N8WDK9_9GLOM|nr:659_t:CDS:1 [Ambispora gerdemannii]